MGLKKLLNWLFSVKTPAAINNEPKAMPSIAPPKVIKRHITKRKLKSAIPVQKIATDMIAAMDERGLDVMRIAKMRKGLAAIDPVYIGRHKFFGIRCAWIGEIAALGYRRSDLERLAGVKSEKPEKPFSRPYTDDKPVVQHVAVGKQRSQHGSHRAIFEAQKEQILRWRAEGKSLTEMAALTGIPAGTISRYVLMAGASRKEFAFPQSAASAASQSEAGRRGAVQRWAGYTAEQRKAEMQKVRSKVGAHNGKEQKRSEKLFGHSIPESMSVGAKISFPFQAYYNARDRKAMIEGDMVLMQFTEKQRGWNMTMQVTDNGTIITREK